MAVNRFSKMYSVTCKTFLLFVLVLLWVSVCVGCRTVQSERTDSKPCPPVYTYQPLNPITVWIRDPTCAEKAKHDWLNADITSYEFNKALLRDLDTETVRIALNTLEGNIDLKAGVVGTSTKGKSYVLIVDYIKYLASAKKIDQECVYSNTQEQDVEKLITYNLPIYKGIGLRIRAEFTALKNDVDISGLTAIAIAANSNEIDGRLTVQTLGITGPEVTSLMPLISDISVTSIQNAVQAVAAIKAKIYEKSTTVYPKIVGFESPRRDPELIAYITDYLYRSDEDICPVMVKYPGDETKRILEIRWNLPSTKDSDEKQEESVETDSQDN